MDKHAAVDAARLRQLLVPHSQTIWEDSLTQSKGVARNINPTYSPNSHNPFSQIPRIVLVVEGHHKLDLSLHISLLFNVVQELHIVAGLLEEENRSGGIHLARLIKRLHSHVTMKGPPSPRWFEREGAHRPVHGHAQRIRRTSAPSPFGNAPARHRPISDG